MKFAIVNVTPELAQSWLAMNTNNRPVSVRRVNDYAKDMAAGNWELTHQGVAISVDNVIADGQHRLLAIVKSGITVPMLVTLDLPTKAIIAVDRGYARSISAAINMAYEGTEWITPQVAAITRWVYDYDRSSNSTSSEILQAATEVQSSLMYAIAQTKGAAAGIRRAPVVGTIALLHHYNTNTDRLDDFCRKLVTGVVGGAADSAVLRLREWLLTSSAATYAQRLASQAKTQRAFTLFMAGAECKRLQVPDSLPYKPLNYPTQTNQGEMK